MTATDVPLATVVRPLSYEAGRLLLLDQIRLPHEEVWLECESALQTAEAIRSLAVRGAPLIGVAAAFGLCVEARRVAARSPEDLDIALSLAAERLGAARPTAVNLRWAVDRMRRLGDAGAGVRVEERIRLLEREALRITEEDRLACLAIGRSGAGWVAAHANGRPGEPRGLLTHCNAGALATAGIGTALGVVRALAAHERVLVFACETRPFLQGARLTAWELLKDRIDVTVLPDVAAASTIAGGRIAAVVVGADRIARNGDVANKVGTYGLALACRTHGVPLVVAAPSSTLDLSCPDGNSIPIEVRPGTEVTSISSPAGEPVPIAPAGASALYPAFDVTPAGFVDAIVTERGISTPPHGENLARLGAR